MKEEELKELGEVYRNSISILNRIESRFRNLSEECEHRTVEPAPSRGDNEWCRCHHKEHTYAGLSITSCSMQSCPLIREKDIAKKLGSLIEPEIRRMYEDCWDSGLKVWGCQKCNIGILELNIDEKPDKCPRCGNKNLIRQED